MELCIRIDNRLHDRRLEKQGPAPLRPTLGRPGVRAVAASAPPSGGQTVSQLESPHQPMDIDGARPRSRPLSPEERQRRRDLGLCMYCGQPGHIAVSCPNKGQAVRNPRADSAILAETAEQPENDRVQD
jgi:hypothetical protein